MQRPERFTWKAGDLESIDTGKRRFDGPCAGPGRWAVLDGIGTLWTNDNDGALLGPAEMDDERDHAAANRITHLLLSYAEYSVPVSRAFDLIVAEYGSPEVHSGELDHLFDWYDQVE